MTNFQVSLTTAGSGRAKPSDCHVRKLCPLTNRLTCNVASSLTTNLQRKLPSSSMQFSVCSQMSLLLCLALSDKVHNSWVLYGFTLSHLFNTFWAVLLEIPNSQLNVGILECSGNLWSNSFYKKEKRVLYPLNSTIIYDHSLYLLDHIPFVLHLQII
jgi:hypothetical protein